MRFSLPRRIYEYIQGRYFSYEDSITLLNHRSDVLNGDLPFHHILPLLMNITNCEVHQNIPNFSLYLFHIFKSAESSYLRSEA